MTKRGPDQKTLTKRRTLLFVDREVFDIHVVVGIDPRPGRMSAFPWYTTIHMFTITVSEQPNAQWSVVQALSSLEKKTYVLG